MKPFIVVADGMDKNVFATLTQQDQLDVHPTPKVSQQELAELLPRVSGLVIRSATTVTKELIEKAPNLKYVIRAGEGTDNIDKAYCQEKGIAVSNTPGANANSAAEHAIALMMTVLRKTASANQRLQEGGWDKSAFTGMELWKKKIGIVGFGNIGQIVARRLAGFEPEVYFFDPICDTTDIPYAKRVSDLKELFKTCDIVSLHVPLTAGTKNIINAELFELMPKHAILINAARGGVVNEADLKAALETGKIRGAALDVFASEPLPENSELRKVEGLVITPHLGASTEEAQVRVGEMAVHQLQEFFIQNKLLNEVRV